MSSYLAITKQYMCGIHIVIRAVLYNLQFSIIMLYCEVLALLNDRKCVYNVFHFPRAVIQYRGVITTRFLLKL